jgi:signal transduction histidine kinase
VSDPNGTAATDLHSFAAAVAHEIRTPLSAVAGEVEIALRRERSAAEYREALHRIAAGVSELVEISGDLSLLGDPADPPATASSVALDTILSRLRDRYRGREDVTISIDRGAAVLVAGDDERLGRAIALVLEHATRHRKGPATVCLCAVTTPAGGVRLLVDAQPSGFWPRAWNALAGNMDRADCPLRLRTALRILGRSGAALLVARASGRDVVHIEFPRSG